MLGIDERLPKSSPHLNFKILKGETIRLLNKIIEYMNVNKIDTVEEFWGVDNIESNTIHWIKLRGILRDYKIIPFGEELNEDFIDFLSVNEDYSDLIHIK